MVRKGGIPRKIWAGVGLIFALVNVHGCSSLRELISAAFVMRGVWFLLYIFGICEFFSSFFLLCGIYILGISFTFAIMAYGPEAVAWRRCLVERWCCAFSNKGELDVEGAGREEGCKFTPYFGLERISWVYSTMD